MMPGKDILSSLQIPTERSPAASAMLSIVVDVTSPKVAFSSPSSGARTTNFIVTGTAMDNAQVMIVNGWITNEKCR